LRTPVLAVREPAPTTRIRRTFTLYAALIRAELVHAAAYRAQLLFGVVEWLVPLAFLALWRSAAAQGPVGGITATQFSTYFCLLLFTTNLQFAMVVIYVFGDRVYSGQLSALLVQPVHAIHQIVAMGLAAKIYQLPVLLVLVPIALVFTGGAITAGGSGWLIGVLVMLLGTVSVVYLAAMTGTVSFWMTKAQGVQGLLIGAEWVLGGIVAPVALLPGPWAEIVRHQPLWYADAAAPEFLSGISEPSWWVVLEAAVWVVGLHLAYRVLWRHGLRRYEAVGT
jgi:ABC-2 type transport system permease protein